MQGPFSDKPGLLPTLVRSPRWSGQPISDSPEMGERATGEVPGLPFFQRIGPSGPMAGAGGPGRGRATASCVFLTNASGKCRPACGWEAGRHLVPQLRRGTTLRPFPHRQHARPPLRPRPFGPNVRAILSQAVQGAREPCDPARTLLWCAVPCLRAPYPGAHGRGKASLWNKSYPSPAPLSPFRNGSFLTPFLPSAGL